MGNQKVLLPFRYPGGKYYALNYLRPFWEKIEHDEFREPFVGGAAVFFAKKKVQHNWLNDISRDLIKCYQVMANPQTRQELIDLVKNEEATKERWQEVKSFTPENDIQEAFKFYYLNRTSFSGKLSSPAWGYRPKRSLPPNRWSERIIPCGAKLEDVKITNLDFEEVISAPSIGKSTLLYVDPPYYKPPMKKHYLNGFKNCDHQRLCKLLQQTDHKFFLTYENDSDIIDLYSWANQTEIDFYYRVDNSQTQNGKRKVGKELVISNYKIPGRLKIDEF